MDDDAREALDLPRLVGDDQPRDAADELEGSDDALHPVHGALRRRGALLDAAALTRSCFTESGFDPRAALERLRGLGAALLDGFTLDDRVLVGTFVHPEQVAEIQARFPEISRMRLVVDNPQAQDRMVLQCELEQAPDALALRLREVLREQTKLRGEVAFVARGGLPNDGKVIEDRRVY